MCRGPLAVPRLENPPAAPVQFSVPTPSRGGGSDGPCPEPGDPLLSGLGVIVAILPLSACHPGTGLCDTSSFMLLGCAPLSSQHVKGRPSLGQL